MKEFFVEIQSSNPLTQVSLSPAMCREYILMKFIQRNEFNFTRLSVNSKMMSASKTNTI